MSQHGRSNIVPITKRRKDDVRVLRQKIRRLETGVSPRVLDLFAGCGGFSLGFHASGFDIAASVEFDPDAARSHGANFHPKDVRHAEQRDITKTSPGKLTEALGLGTPEAAFDVIIGGPPCQAFARVGRSKLREVADHPEAFRHDPRARLYIEYIEYVKECAPLAVVIENVPDMLNFAGHNIAHEICEVLSGLGYICGYTLMNAAMYGVPQMRERAFLMAIHQEVGATICFPEPTHRITLPPGYEGTRAVALKLLADSDTHGPDSFWKPTLEPGADLPHAVTASEALGDLPLINALQELAGGRLRRGARRFDTPIQYSARPSVAAYVRLMREWPGFPAPATLLDHVIRYLPRDYKLFARLAPGDQYPEAHEKAEAMFREELDRRRASRKPLREGSEAWEELRVSIVPPYDHTKFPNKWRKMEADKPARTLMAHLADVAEHCVSLPWQIVPHTAVDRGRTKSILFVPTMPKDEPPERPLKPRTIREKIRNTHFLEQMLKVAGDLSAPAQLRFLETVDRLATQLREILLATGGIIRVDRNHSEFWPSVKGQRIGFVDGGLANLSMLGSAPIAARVGGYTVVPGSTGPERETFVVLKQLIDELYAHEEGGVYSDSFPDIGALRDAARISIEAAGAVNLISELGESLKWLFVHGALVNPVSRYTDVMREGRIAHHFPNFSETAIATLLPPDEPSRSGRERNFISVHLRQMQLLEASDAVVCGVVERESTTTSVCRAVLDDFDDDLIRDLLPLPPAEWKHWFRNAVDPSGNDDFEGQRITDSLLFRCVLEPGEALMPVVLDRNEARRAPDAWKAEIAQYPKPLVSYLQATEWNAPVRIELFSKNRAKFGEIAALVLHCSLLLPRYAFPVGLDIVDKFARVPDWMSRPINTHTAVRAMRTALDKGDDRLFDALRRMLCGSGREFLLRPGIFR